MKTIFKYPMSSSIQVIPVNAVFRHVGVQLGVVTLWAEVDPTQPMERVEFMVFGTGQEIPDGLEYVGTVQDEPFVWHLYRVVKSKGVATCTSEN